MNGSHRRFLVTSSAAPLIFMILFAFSIAETAGATTLAPPCTLYTYLKQYTLDENSLPPDVIVMTDNKTQYLVNKGTKPLVFEIDDSRPTRIIKLMNEEVLIQYSGKGEYTTYAGRSAIGAANLRGFMYLKAPASYSSNVLRTDLTPIRFPQIAEYDGKAIKITGTISYQMYENDCSTSNADSTKSSFWSRILTFLISLKFW